jgi:hypothetical protein
VVLRQDAIQTFIDALPLAREKSGQLQAGEESHAARSDNGQLTPSVRLSINLYSSIQKIDAPDKSYIKRLGVSFVKSDTPSNKSNNPSTPARKRFKRL